MKKINKNKIANINRIAMLIIFCFCGVMSEAKAQCNPLCGE